MDDASLSVVNDYTSTQVAYTKALLESLLRSLTPENAARTLRVVSDTATLQLQQLQLLDPGGAEVRGRNRMRHAVQSFGSSMGDEDGPLHGHGAPPQDMTARFLEEGMAAAQDIFQSVKVKNLTDAYVRAKTLKNDPLAERLQMQLNALLPLATPPSDAVFV